MTPSAWWSSYVKSPAAFRTALLRWHAKAGRSLPWRDCPDPYAVWVSEVMLQQTQVATVVSYYRRFLDKYPDVSSLANADEAELLRLWEGLGYYRRARMMQKSAQAIVAQFHGMLPADAETLASLPGFGRYTANAVLTFSQQQRLPILEANTKRLWSRLCGLEIPADSSAAQRELWRIAEAALPAKSAGKFNQALMDLGATVCTARSPNCPKCPMRSYCRAFAHGTPERFPPAKPKRTAVAVEHAAIVIESGERLLLTQRPAEAIWGNLWEFPRVEMLEGENAEVAAKRAAADRIFGRVVAIREIGVIRHAVMHYRIRLHGFRAMLKGQKSRILDERTRWVDRSDLEKMPLSSPQRGLASLFFLDCSNSKRI